MLIRSVFAFFGLGAIGLATALWVCGDPFGAGIFGGMATLTCLILPLTERASHE